MSEEIGLMLNSILAIILGCLFGKYAVARLIIWAIERKWGKHYRVKFKDCENNSSVVHVWTKQEDLMPVYAAMIQEVNNIIKQGVKDRIGEMSKNAANGGM